MTVSALTASFLLANAAWPLQGPEKVTNERFARLVQSVQEADYRADRTALQRLAGEIDDLDLKNLASYQKYWVAFAWWRRAINGMNETPTPTDLLSDVTRCAHAANRALEIDPHLEDALSALSSCRAMMIGQSPEEERPALVPPALEAYAALASKKDSTRNPRTLWMLAGFETYRGQAKTAAETLQRALELVLVEARLPPSEPWIPRWGGPEILMSLAYGHSRPPLIDGTVARVSGYAALFMVPHWHYLRDILLPQVDALPRATPVSSPPAR